MSGRRWTVGEEQFLRDNIDKVNSYAELAERLNEALGTNRSAQQVSDKCCKGMHILRGVNTGRFGKGLKSKGEAPIGEERQFGGYWMVKVDAIHTGDVNKDFRHNWMFKQRYVWERYCGPLKEHEIVIFLDGNKNNFELTNLYKINRRIHAQMCQKRLYSDAPELTLLALRACEILDYRKGENNELPTL